MTVPHLLLVGIPAIALTLLFSWLQGLIGVSLSFEARVWMSLPFALLASIFLAWPLARLFRVAPLMIFSGPCPTCGRRPSGWRGDARDRDRLLLACGECGGRVDVWLINAPSSGRVSSAVANYVLRTPKFLGVWRRLDPPEGTELRRLV